MSLYVVSAMQHDTFSRNTRNQLKQVFDALRELMPPPDPPQWAAASSWLFQGVGLGKVAVLEAYIQRLGRAAPDWCKVKLHSLEVSHTYTATGADSARVSIISACEATRNERWQYENEPP